MSSIFRPGTKRPVKTNLIITIIAIIAMIGGVLISDKVKVGSSKDFMPEEKAGLPSLKVGDIRPDFTLPDITGKNRSVSEWDTKVLVINFWATWCPPCRAEIPMFIKLQSRYADKGLQFVGIAIDDQQRVKEFVEEYGINYPTLIGDEEATMLSVKYGNKIGALPFTVIIDQKKRVTTMHAGEIRSQFANKNIISLLEK